MDELEKLRNPYKQWPHHQFSFTSWPSVDFMFHYGFLANEQHESSIDWNTWPIDEVQWATMVSSCIVKPPTTLALSWPCFPVWIKAGGFCGLRTKPWGLEGVWIIGSCGHMVHPNCLLSHMMQTCCYHLCKVPFHRMLCEQFKVQWECFG